MELVLGDLIGYARVSSRGQSLEIQTKALREAGVAYEYLYQEKASGKSRKGREELKDMLVRGIRRGDTLVVTRLDRLARSTRDLLQIAEKLEEKGADLRVLEQPVDTTNAAGKLFFTILGAFGEFEATIRAERQREGIDAALAKGADSPFRGRPASIDGTAIREAVNGGESPSALAKRLGIARSSVYRYLGDQGAS